MYVIGTRYSCNLHEYILFFFKENDKKIKLSLNKYKISYENVIIDCQSVNILRLHVY